MTSGVIVSGGTGQAGRFIVEDLLSTGHKVTVLGRNKPAPDCFSRPVTFIRHTLGSEPDPAVFEGAAGFVHAAFDHAPGKYRGGEGDDTEGFRNRNLEGSIALFKAAKQAGVARAVFLSSRAVYGAYPPGTRLTEDLEPNPDTLYGEIKYATERELASMVSDSFLPVSLRITGIYGPAKPGESHKWTELFADFAAGAPIEPRVATEVHGDDVAAAVSMMLTLDRMTLMAAGGDAPLFNVSDIALDRRDLLSAINEACGSSCPLPERADAAALNVMDCRRLYALGWRPRGMLDLTGLSPI